MELALAAVEIRLMTIGLLGQCRLHQLKLVQRLSVMNPVHRIAFFSQTTHATVEWAHGLDPVETQALVAAIDLVGGPMPSGFDGERVCSPANLINYPHSHPEDRTYTVISGALVVGFGDTLNRPALKALPPGSF